MKTIKEILDASVGFLEGKGVPLARRQAEEILSTTLNISRFQLYLEFDRPLEAQELDVCRSYLERRGKREPLAYIIPKLEFYHCTLAINSDVLIPRQETEILADLIVKRLQGISLKGKVLWDLCCGSGCLGIALKKAFPELAVYCSDISVKALEVARQNALSNGVEIVFLQGDLLEPFKGLRTDFLVCNPPYVSEREWEGLEAEVKDYEPRGALVSGPSGFEVYKQISEKIPTYCKAGAQLFFEIGASQGEGVKEMFSLSPWQNPEVLQDWAGLDRFFFVSR